MEGISQWRSSSERTQQRQHSDWQSTWRMTSTASFIPIVPEEVIIIYGFYDAGPGVAGLPDRDQCYATIYSTRNQSWMGNVAPPGSSEAQNSFSRLVLAAPRGNGMNSMQNCDAV